MTDTVKVLSDDALREIEAAQVKRRESLAFHQSEYPGLPSPPYIEEIDALCATVRALRTALSKANEIVEEAVHTNTALREQLAQVENERDELRTQMSELTHVNNEYGDRRR